MTDLLVEFKWSAKLLRLLRLTEQRALVILKCSQKIYFEKLLSLNRCVFMSYNKKNVLMIKVIKISNEIFVGHILCQCFKVSNWKKLIWKKFFLFFLKYVLSLNLCWLAVHRWFEFMNMQTGNVFSQQDTNRKKFLLCQILEHSRDSNVKRISF